MHPVVEHAMGILGIVEELQADTRQVTHGRFRTPLPRGDKEDAGHVIGAEPVLMAGLVEQGMFEGTPVVSHPEKVVKVGDRRRHHTSAGRSFSRRLARARI
jgi:hypothetical protein